MAAADEFSRIREDIQVRPVFEALLIDNRTPEKVFVDLFGVDNSFVARYKETFDGLWNIPRIFLFKEILTIKEENIRALYEDVFNGGWEIIDSLYNRGKNVNAADAAIRIVKVSAAKGVADAVRGDKINPVLLSAAKSMIGSVGDYNEILEGDTEEDWQLMVKAINDKQKSREVSPVTKKAYDTVMERFRNKGFTAKESQDADKV